MTQKIKELEDELKKLYEKLEKNKKLSYLDDGIRLHEIIAELKGRQESRKETLTEVEKMIDKFDFYNVYFETHLLRDLNKNIKLNFKQELQKLKEKEK